MIHSYPLWNLVWWNPVVFCWDVLVSRRGAPQVWLPRWSLFTVSPLVILSQGVDPCLPGALWELGEVTYLRQLARTKYLIHFTAPLQTPVKGRWPSDVDRNTSPLGFSSLWSWQENILKFLYWLKEKSSRGFLLFFSWQHMCSSAFAGFCVSPFSSGFTLEDSSFFSELLWHLIGLSLQFVQTGSSQSALLAVRSIV